MNYLQLLTPFSVKMARLLPSSCNINANVVSRVSFQTISKFQLANLRAITKRLLGIILPQDSDRGGTVQKVLKESL